MGKKLGKWKGPHGKQKVTSREMEQFKLVTATNRENIAHKSGNGKQNSGNGKAQMESKRSQVGKWENSTATNREIEKAQIGKYSSQVGKCEKNNL